MNIFARLRLVRIVLVAGVVLRALGWGALAVASLLIGAALVDVANPLTVATRTAVLGVAIASGFSIAAALLWRDRRVLSLEHVALWIEERFPSLEFTLATAVEIGDESLVTRDSEPWTKSASRGAARVVVAPLIAISLAIIVLLVLPAGAVGRVRAPRAGDSIDRPGIGARDAESRLTPLVAEVAPPGYSGQRSASIDEPSDIRALVGSVVTLRGRGGAAGIVARNGSDSIAARTDNGRWSVVLRVSARPSVVRLTDRTFQRIIAIEPIVDNSPAITLNAPARDSVLRAPTGRIPLAADASDDFGIASAAFEYIISSGEGETFKFRSGTLGATRPNGRRTSISAMLSLESLSLKPGDIVHVRAVASDANNVSGPGIGASETRAIRIARRDEYDSVAVEAAAPSEEEKSVISERMLILLAEALQKKRPTLKRDSVVGESRSIARDQKQLRRTVGKLVFTRLGGQPSGEEEEDDDVPTRAKTMEEMLARADSATNRSADPIDFEGGESPVVAVNKPLLEAYNAMWEAGTELEIGEPGRALPHMRRALAAIQRARLAERVYLRGRPPPVVVDVNKARLQGKDKGASSGRRSLAALDSMVRLRTERLSRIIESATRDPRAAIDSLLVLRVESLSDNASFAAALSDAANAMRRGRIEDAAAALARARRSLAGAPVVRDSLSRWGIVP